MAGRTKRSCRHPLRSPPPLLPYSVEKKKEFHSHSADALCRRRRRPLLKPNGRLQFFPFSTASKIEVQIKLPFTSEEERGRGKGRSIEGYRHFHKRADMYIYIYMRKHILLAALRSRYFSTPSSAFFSFFGFLQGRELHTSVRPFFLYYTHVHRVTAVASEFSDSPWNTAAAAALLLSSAVLPEDAPYAAVGRYKIEARDYRWGAVLCHHSMATTMVGQRLR